MEDAMNDARKDVFVIIERGEKTFWTRIGSAWVNRDGSINVQMDALPISGKIQIRDAEPRAHDDQRESPNGGASPDKPRGNDRQGSRR
jgi:hypothetical protein